MWYKKHITIHISNHTGEKDQNKKKKDGKKKKK